MEKIIIPIVEKTREIIRITRVAIYPFTEQPGDGRSGAENLPGNKINATELFCFFTANIMKEEVVFTR